MKFTSITIAAAAIGLHPNNGVTGSPIVDRHVKSMTATHLFPGAHYGIEVDASEKSWSEIVNTRADRSFGRAWLEKRFIREMQEFGGVYSSDLSSGDALTKMRVTHIVKTSEWHTDGIVGGGRLSAGSSQQGFYVLNDNPHAYFETDDDELCIPFVRGSFLAFNGRKPHRTVINDGSVDLLGPFDLQSLKCVLPCGGPCFIWCECCCRTIAPTTTHSGKAKGKGQSSTRNLEVEETGAALEHHVVMGNFTDPSTNQTSSYFATNATIAQAEKFRLGFTKSEECTDEAHSNALITQVSEERRIITDTPGARGWHMQLVTQLDDDETPALNDFITGADSNYTLVAFFYNLEKNLVACAHLKQHDKDTAAMYDELLLEVAAAKFAGGDDDGVDAVEGANDSTSSGSKNGLVAVLSAFAAVGIAAMMGYALAL